MHGSIALQESMDHYIKTITGDEDGLATAEECMEGLGHYLLHYSDLFQEPDGEEEPDFAEWEESLEEQMVSMLEGDVDPTVDLGHTPLSELDPEHVRDFIGWFVPRETGDAEMIQSYASVLQGWFDFLLQRHWLKLAAYQSFTQVLNDVVPEAVRTARASKVMFHFIRSGGGVPHRLRSQRFSRFAEGHARVCDIRDGALWFSFESQSDEIGPVAMPQVILNLIRKGDVFDVELGLRGDTWVMVDIGPVYPACVYVEVEEYKDLEKIS